MGHHARVAPIVEPPNSVLLVVGREEFTPPSTFGAQSCVATHDCVAIGVASVDDAAISVDFAAAVARDDLQRLGRFPLETEGMLSVRDVYNREYDAAGVTPGRVLLTVWGNDAQEPSEILLEIREA